MLLWISSFSYASSNEQVSSRDEVRYANTNVASLKDAANATVARWP